MDIYELELTDIPQNVGIDETTHDAVIDELEQTEVQKSDALADAFWTAIYETEDIGINTAKLWNDLLKPTYILLFDDYTQQSWRVTSGEAFERFLASYYSSKLSNQYRVCSHTSSSKTAVLESLGLNEEIGDEKVDLTVEYKHQGDWYILGCPHVKTSLRERISDISTASKIMIENNIYSPVITLDLHDELGNAGQEKLNESRSLVEERASFSHLYSWNTETQPTTDSDAEYQVKTIDITTNSDAFIKDINRTHEKILNTKYVSEYLSPEYE